ncbi:MAG: hypothetical protein MZW92_57895, partial [Comamonadaceae bacterium]|nr:hypothetical protein [Comamonadaceae bacterium]
MVRNGAVVIVSPAPTTLQQVSYVGGNIQADVLAVGGTSVAYSNTISAVKMVPVSAGIAAPTDATIASWRGQREPARQRRHSTQARRHVRGRLGLCQARPRATATRCSPATARSRRPRRRRHRCPADQQNPWRHRTPRAPLPERHGRQRRSHWTLATEHDLHEIAAQAAGTNCPPFGVRYWVATP